MIKGLNEEVVYKGIRFHLQIQDLGPREPVIQALLYRAGRVIHTRRVSYASYLNQPNQAEKAQALLNELYSAILADIYAGKLDHLLNPNGK